MTKLGKSSVATDAGRVEAKALIAQAVLGVGIAEARAVARGVFDFDRAVECVADHIARHAALATQPATSQEGEAVSLVKALKWYEAMVADCRKITPIGDAARRALDADGGKTATAALAATPTPPAMVAVPKTAKELTAIIEQWLAQDTDWGEWEKALHALCNPDDARPSVAENLRDALDRVEKALKINATDTLGRIGVEKRVVWTASGSWSGSQAVTIGDIKAIAAFARAQVKQ